MQDRPGARMFEIVQRASERITLQDDPDIFQIAMGMLQPIERVLFAGQYCQSEVCNGGFWQFFHNSTGVLAPEARDAFEAIGIPAWAACVEDAMRVFGPRYPRAREARWTKLDRLAEDPFRAIDERFYAWKRGDMDAWHRVADAYAERQLH